LQYGPEGISGVKLYPSGYEFQSVNFSVLVQTEFHQIVRVVSPTPTLWNNVVYLHLQIVGWYTETSLEAEVAK
jgi:hypothetical protein